MQNTPARQGYTNTTVPQMITLRQQSAPPLPTHHRRPHSTTDTQVYTKELQAQITQSPHLWPCMCSSRPPAPRPYIPRRATAHLSEAPCGCQHTAPCHHRQKWPQRPPHNSTSPHGAGWVRQHASASAAVHLSFLYLHAAARARPRRSTPLPSTRCWPPAAPATPRLSGAGPPHREPRCGGTAAPARR